MKKILLALLILVECTGCSKLMGSLRRDFDDQPEDAWNPPPTVGGRWSEKGFLNDDYPESGSRGAMAMGHTDRNPASDSTGGGVSSSPYDPADRDGALREANMRDGEAEMAVNSGNVANLAPSVKRQYKNGSRATRADFIDESQNEGSLWASDGQTNYYFTKNKVRGVGDIITINIEDPLVKDIGMDARRSLNEGEREYELAAAQQRIKDKTMGVASAGDGKTDAAASGAAAPNRAPAGANAAPKEASKDADKQIEIPKATLADVDVGKSLELKAGDTMMGEIVERYPNGNYKVRATKKVLYKGGSPRLVHLVAVVKGSDIAEDDTVASGKLYEYRVEATR